MNDEGNWWSSRTKIGGVIVAVCAIGAAVGRVLTGDLDLVLAIPIVFGSIGVLTTLLGLRDAL